MMNTKRKLITITLLFAFFALLQAAPAGAAPIPSGFKVWPLKTTDDFGKTWTIKFNMPLDPATINSQNIYVTDDNNQPVATVLSPSPDSAAVAVTPASPYTPGKEYRLFITSGLTSAKGGLPLHPPVVVPFTVADSKAKIIAISSTYSSFLTSITVITSPDVYSVKVGLDEMHYQGGNTYTLGIPGLKIGDVVTIRAYDSNDRLLESKKHTVG
jgi:hypothetical protein